MLRNTQKMLGRCLRDTREKLRRFSVDSLQLLDLELIWICLKHSSEHTNITTGSYWKVARHLEVSF